MGKQSVSIKDVARHSGVSIATVSNVLNNRCPVSDALRERVLAAVEELHYVANPIARSMRSSKTFTVGVVVLDINCIFFAPLLKGIQNVMSKAGYSVITYDSNYNSELEIKYVQTMKNNMVDGIILAGLSNGQDENLRSILHTNGGKDMPIVSIESNLTAHSIDSVFVDNQKAAYTATSHMVELGCKRIAFIAPPQSTYSADIRRMGYRKALRDAGLKYDAQLELPGDFSAISGYNDVQSLLRADIPFDGIFAANDQMAVGAIRALHNAKIAIPEDVKVVGFDNTFVASIVEPALTTINVPKYEMGVAAAQQLLARIEKPQGKVVSIPMDFELVIRRSTMAFARTNWDMVHW